LFEGYEMQKAIRGHTTHERGVVLPIFENTQDIPALADRLTERWESAVLPHGFLVRGHGLYAWGASAAEARRHVEGWEFLMQCRLTERLLEGRA
jgi:methylthioribulose-1-phosphate dehydratase